MPIHKSWKKIVTGAVAITLVSSAALPVLPNQVAIVHAAEKGITPFTDVPAGLYAEKHIYRLSLQQIVKGYENKATGEFTFKYNNTISQQEAVIMAIRFAGLEHKVDKNGVFIFPEGFDVKEDYKAYISLAFDEGLLDREQEFAIAAAEPDEEWGAKPAAREWVTKLIIHTIGAQAKAKELQETPSTFADRDKIDSKYTGYVNAAVELGLVKGYTETTFAPKTAINRASFATILSRAQKDFPIKVANQQHGVITNMTDNSITIYEHDVETTYAFDQSTGFYSSDSDLAVKRDQFKLYSAVSLIHIDGVAKFVETLGEEIYTEELIAPVGILNTNEKIIYVVVDNNPVAIAYDETTNIIDSSGEKLAINDLKVNSKIKITTDTFRSTPKVISIELITAGDGAVSSVTGTYFSYLPSSNMITVKTEDGQLVSKLLTKTPTITIPYVKHATLDSLIVNADKVTLTMNAKDEVVSITVPSGEYKTLYLPTIVSSDDVKGLITVLDAAGTSAEALFISDSTRYLLDGVIVDPKYISTDPTEWKGLMLRYVEANGKKQVVYYDMISEISGYVEDINYFEETIKLKLPDGVIAEFSYDNAGIESLTKSKPTYLDIKEDNLITVDLSSEDGTITQFRLHEIHSMSISSISNVTKEVSFKREGNTYSVLFDEAEFVDNNGKVINFSDLKSNKNVIVSFAGDRILRVIVQ
ncbi:S-layer homology domain-containing protein [Paenibacillus sp. FSL W7-1287]|uniref:S-layer homology domain-containing protein n=1 Tax=Paenibacillus sp. FSL W7-1287 TaxID=2954538 RepID=UPI0030F628E8